MQARRIMIGAAPVEERARQSLGISNDAILNMVVRALDRRKISGSRLVDVGCGTGNFFYYVRDRFTQYVGVDAVRYEDFPAEAEFRQLDLDSGRIPLPDASGDVVVAIEVIEHLKNPRDFMRNLVRVAAPGGWVVVTTPNQLSLLSLLTLVTKHRFQAFQDIHYPTHLTALLEVDLRRIAAECGLENIAIDYRRSERIPMTGAHYPGWLSRQWPGALSEKVLVFHQRTDRP